MGFFLFMAMMGGGGSGSVAEFIKSPTSADVINTGISSASNLNTNASGFSISRSGRASAEVE